MCEPSWVAIIDDDESVRTSLARLLRCAGIAAVAIDSAETFLDRSAGSEPACILLDVHLGAGLNGLEFRERLRSTGRSLPIVFMTGMPEGPLPRALSEDGAVDVLCKPFEADDVLARVRRHVYGAQRPPHA